MKRRKFLIAVGAGALVTAVAAGKFLTTSFEDSAEAIIKRELGFLNLDAAGVKAFVADFAKAKDRLYKLTVKGYSFLRIVRILPEHDASHAVVSYILAFEPHGSQEHTR